MTYHLVGSDMDDVAIFIEPTDAEHYEQAINHNKGEAFAVAAETPAIGGRDAQEREAAELRLSQVNAVFFAENFAHPQNPDRIRMSPAGMVWEAIDYHDHTRLLSIKCAQTGQMNVMPIASFMQYKPIGDEWVVIPPRYVVMNPVRPGETFDNAHLNENKDA